MESNMKNNVKPIISPLNLNDPIYEDINSKEIKKKLRHLEQNIESENKNVLNESAPTENNTNNINDARNSMNLVVSISNKTTHRLPPLIFSQNNFVTKNYKLEAVDMDKYNRIKQNAGYLLFNGERIKTNMDDLVELCELGSGTCGQVIKMKHKKTDQLIAVKQMRISGVVEENKRIIMDLDVVLKCHNCENIVSCLGYFISDTEVWICMDLMTMCFDKLLKRIKKPIPEDILGKLTVCTLNALSFLKQKHNVIHRDIKPSNLLINENGDIKLCDFGISGNLVDSRVQTRNAGCAGYMAPERLELNNSNYDIRADVWSLGITLVELATGEYPYKKCSTDFEVMTAIVNNDPPKLEGDHFSQNFKEFVRQCLIKDVKKRPKYDVLLLNPFVLHHKNANIDVKNWFTNVLELCNN